MNVSIEITEELVAELARRVSAEMSETSDTSSSGFLDVAGAAEFLCCSTSRIYGLVSARRIPHYKDGSRVLFDPDELREYVRNGGARCP